MGRFAGFKPGRKEIEDVLRYLKTNNKNVTREDAIKLLEDRRAIANIIKQKLKK